VPNDPTPRRAIGFDGRDRLYSALDTLNEHEAAVMALRYGITDGKARTLDEIARIYGMSWEWAKRVYDDTIRKLQLGSIGLEVWEQGQLVDTVDMPSHARSMAAAIPVAWCSQCGEVPLITSDEISKGGRPREYCSAGCRQAAYRARRAAGEANQTSA
jgi:Sigma-70, region 4